MVVIMTLQDAVRHFQQYMTNSKIANKLGVSTGQLMKYASGKTVSCNDDVLDKFYDFFTFDGNRILLDYFPTEAIYVSTRTIRDEGFKPCVGSEIASDKG